LTAIVVVSDDGGSSGRLRDELHVPPPGDLRMALSALCEDTEWGLLWRDVLQHRFSTEGPLDGHALGNLLIAGLWSRTGDVIEGLDWVARLLRAQGRVLPLASEALQISAEVELEDGVRAVSGQVAVATAPGRISRVWLEPASPRVPGETLEAIDSADVVALGPGSWYSSVLPHHEDDETNGMGRIDDVEALREMAPGFSPAVVIVDERHADESGLRDLVEGWGARLIVRAMLKDGSVDRHDPALFADAYREAFGLILGRDLEGK
jgi:2-phospho-L-lactate transferase/gluconeogenesis factor (CofD/UPF0052 family)